MAGFASDSWQETASGCNKAKFVSKLSFSLCDSSFSWKLLHMRRVGDSSLAIHEIGMGKGNCLRLFASAFVGSILMLTASLQAGTYQVGVAPPTVKVMIQGAAEGWPLEGTITNRYDLHLARGEHEAMQVVVIAADALTNVSVNVSQPQETPGAGPLNGEAKAWLVGHVDVYDWTGYSDYYPGREDYHGWYPDPLLTFTNGCSSINAGDRVAFWIDASALREASAGDYEATITVTADDSPSTNVQLNIQVWDFALPLKASLPTMFSLNEWLTGNPGGPRPVYGETAWVNKGIAQQFYDLMLERRMGGMHLYRMEDWTEVEAYNNVTDWAARGCSDVNLKNLGSPNPAQLDRVTDPALSNLVSQLSGAGLLGMTYVYGYDEAGSGSFGAMSNMFNKVHTSYPGLRTMTTAKDSSFGTTTGLRSVVDIWVPQTDDYNQAAANQLRAEGKDMWWYIYSSPWRPYINFYVEYPAIEPRLLMGAMAYKHQTGGFLYYNVTKWPQWDDEWSPLLEENNWLNVPITSGPYTDWFPKSGGAGTGNNGDGSLFCAGPDGPLPTIRTENIRDGLEDYEYLKLLADLVETLQARGSLTPEELAWVNSSQQLLVVPSNVVASLTTYTRDPAALENYREQLATHILTGKVLTAPPRPQLTIAPAATGNVRLLWPTNAPGFDLEVSTNLSAPIWSDLLPAPVVIGTNNVVTNAMTETVRFYRLRN